MGRATVGNLASSIYGTVLTLALIAAYSADEHLAPALIAVAVVITAAVFWLSHVQAELLALRYSVGHALSRDEIVAQLRHSLPMVEAALPPALALLLGGVGLLSDDTAVLVAMGVGVAELAGWGVAVGRRERLGPVRIVGVVALNVALGLAVVGLKLLIH